MSARVKIDLAASAGIAARVQGMRRYYALVLAPGAARLIKAFDDRTVLAEADFDWEFGTTHELTLEVIGAQLKASVDGKQMFEIEDTEDPLESGAIALIVEEGRLAAERVTVRPAGES